MIAQRVNAMPAPTWHFLKMNDTTADFSGYSEIEPRVTVSAEGLLRDADSEFEAALAAAQQEWEQAHPAPTPEEQAALDEALAAEADATYGGTAQSGYQAQADAIEQARSLAVAFEHGTSEEVAAYLRHAAGKRVVVEAAPGAREDVQVKVDAAPDAVSVAAIDVVAGPGSAVRVSLVVDGPESAGGADGADATGPDGAAGANGAGGADGPDAAGAAGAGATGPGMSLAGTTLRIFAGEGAQVEIVRMQTLPDAYDDVDDMALFAAESARIKVRQTVLGAGRSLVGLAGDLRGDSSRVDVDTRYLGKGSQERDFNYALRHHGRKSECALNANGVLGGTSKKTLRGTIDLIRGAKGAQGSENETVLIIDEGVSNKTVPVILCNEDDVAGNHGATIGHVRDEQLFYLASRGLSQEAAERMFASALVEQAALEAVDDESREAAVRWGERMAPGFAALFEE